jgi:TPR repeat protein
MRTRKNKKTINLKRRREEEEDDNQKVIHDFPASIRLKVLDQTLCFVSKDVSNTLRELDVELETQLQLLENAKHALQHALDTRFEALFASLHAEHQRKKHLLTKQLFQDVDSRLEAVRKLESDSSTSTASASASASAETEALLSAPVLGIPITTAFLCVDADASVLVDLLSSFGVVHTPATAEHEYDQGMARLLRQDLLNGEDDLVQQLENDKQAFELLRGAAAQGNTTARGVLAFLSSCNVCVGFVNTWVDSSSGDLAKFALTLEDSAKQGDPFGRALFLRNDTTHADDAMMLLREVASNGKAHDRVWAQFAIAWILLKERAGPPGVPWIHYDEFVHYATLAEVQGLKIANVLLGQLWDKGTPKNSAASFAHFMEAARRGYPIAQCMVAIFFDEGVDAEGNKELARVWYTRAAEQNYVDAQINLGLMHEFGEVGGARNDRVAFSWFLRAAQLGDAEAQYIVGDWLERGRGTSSDSEAAKVWLSRAAEQNIAKAQVRIGDLELLGHNTERAVDWFTRAAHNGDAATAFMLYDIFHSGRLPGVVKDKEAARKWVCLAAQLDHSEAKQVLARERIQTLRTRKAHTTKRKSF